MLEISSNDGLDCSNKIDVGYAVPISFYNKKQKIERSETYNQGSSVITVIIRFQIN